MSRRGGLFAEVDDRAYANAMRILGREVLPQTVAETLNRTAEAVTKQGERNVKRRLIVRTKYTLNSLKRKGAHPYRALNKARGRDINRMFSRAGTISEYLSVQEEGALISAKGAKIPIPTLRARVARNLERMIAKRYRMDEMGEFTEARPDAGSRFFIGRPKGNNRRLGVYERWQGGRKLRMIRNLESASVRVPATHWHRDAVNKYGTMQFIRAQFRDAARKRLRRVRAR